MEAWMKRIALAAALALVAGGTFGVQAADLPRPAYNKAPVYAPPVYSWTGFYVGINGGGAWGRSNWDGIPATFDTSGGLVGGTVGYNWQFGQFVLGAEADAAWANLKGTGCAGLCSTETNFLATARGRFGVAIDRFMPYITGGLAMGNIKAAFPVFPTVDETRLGWTVGAGAEYAVAPNWSVKAEYLYVDLGNTRCGVGTACNFGAGANNQVGVTDHIVRGGVNFRF
jgi:outer membrane immunogenic protein